MNKRNGFFILHHGGMDISSVAMAKSSAMEKDGVMPAKLMGILALIGVLGVIYSLDVA